MKFFFLFFLAATLLTGIYWLVDEPGSGASVACLIFAGLAVAVAVYNTIRFGSPLRDAKSDRLNSLALPLLALHFAPELMHALLIAGGLLAVAALAKAAIDVLTHQPDNNIFAALGKWWDARTSWLNKYKSGSWEMGAPVPRFWGSTGPLVWLTDWWHFADFVYLTAFLVGGLLLGRATAGGPWWWLAVAVVGVKVGFGVVFELGYRKLFRRKQ